MSLIRKSVSIWKDGIYSIVQQRIHLRCCVNVWELEITYQIDRLYWATVVVAVKGSIFYSCEWRNSPAKVYILAMIKCIVFKCLLHNVLCACYMIPYYKTSGCFTQEHPHVLLQNMGMFLILTFGDERWRKQVFCREKVYCDRV